MKIADIIQVLAAGAVHLVKHSPSFGFGTLMPSHVLDRARFSALAL
ncbi:hypothetical protein QTL95_26475 [Rhizobium sp. S152]|nr:hypothetical protein [Rhizobium sp. S152]MDM9629435.1 hypothetical protein [Rhizobium sp. S152]